MLYLSGCLPARADLQEKMLEYGVGILLTPYSQRNLPNDRWTWAADNGCFSSRWEEQDWVRWLNVRQDSGSALFATVPDIVGDSEATLKRWGKYHHMVRELGFKPAFVLQDGATDIPWDEMDALFIGGSTEYKLSQHAERFTKEAKQRGKWVHMGRVNSYRRILLAQSWGCDSVDGTFLAFGPDINTPKLLAMLDKSRPQATLFGT